MKNKKGENKLEVKRKNKIEKKKIKNCQKGYKLFARTSKIGKMLWKKQTDKKRENLKRKKKRSVIGQKFLRNSGISKNKKRVFGKRKSIHKIKIEEKEKK